jgi:hypothetical protein
MSNFGQAALTITGLIVGSAVGFPQLGFVLGSLAGQALFPTQLPPVQGPRLTDTKGTNSQVGGPVQELFGTDAVAGTVIYLGPMQEIATTEEVGGKGGPEQEVTTYTYFQTIAVGLVRGPQVGLRRIWENGKLVYDRREQLDDETDDEFQARVVANAAYEETFVLYLGTDDQLPDPTIEAERGVGEVPAYRDLMYIVYPDRQLQEDQALRHPGFKFEISNEGVDYVLVAVAEDSSGRNVIMTSHDGESWSVQQCPLDGVVTVNTLTCVTFSNELNLFVISALTNNRCLISQDAETWTVIQLPSGTNVDWSGVAWSPELGLFAMCGSSGNTDAMLTSPDGVNWTRRTVPNIQMNDIIWVADLGLFVAVGLSGFALRSADGINWSTSNAIPGPGLYDVVWTGSKLRAVSRSDGTTNSSDGITWTEDADAITTGPTAIASNGSSTVVGTLLDMWRASSPDSSVFTMVHNPDAQIEGLTWAEGLELYVAVMLSGTTGTSPYKAAMTSPDGLTWTEHLTPTDADGQTWTSVCEGVALSSGSGITLAEIVTAICERVGVTSIDVSDLTDKSVEGYVISRVMSADAAIEPLRKAGYFDIVESGTTLKFPERGRASSRTLSEDDLGAQDGTEGSPVAVTTTMAQDVELPRQMRVHFRNPDRDYEDDEELSPSRLITEAVNDVDVELPMAITAAQAAEIAEVLWADAWAGRWAHTWSLDYSHLDLEPADVVLLPVDDELQRVRITSIDDAVYMIRKMQGVRDDDGNYTPVAVTGDIERRGTTLEFISGTLLEFLDLPPLRTDDTDAGFYVAARSSGSGTAWRGAAVYRSIDEGNSFDQLVAVSTEATVCELVNALPTGEIPGGSPTFDENTVITVDVLSGTLESRIESDVFSNGANTLAVGAKGRWLIVSFCTVTQITETRYELTKLLWGRRATEYLIGTPQAGDRAVLISGNGIVRLPLTATQIGEEFIYKAVSIGADFNDGTDNTYEGNGESLMPFSPNNVSFARQVNGDVLISWTRRDRLGQELTDFVDPISDPPLSFEVDIMSNGSPTTVVRLLTSSVESVTYTNAQQGSDFGSPTPTTLTVRVYQISATVGRGHVAEFTGSIF